MCCYTVAQAPPILYAGPHDRPILARPIDETAYIHGFSSRFVIGFTHAVRREIRDGLLRYALGGPPPLGIDEIADFFEIKRDHCYQAFLKFQALVAEQIRAILACEAEIKQTQHDA